MLEDDVRLGGGFQIECRIAGALDESVRAAPGEAAELAKRAMGNLDYPGPLAARADALPIADQDARFVGSAADLQCVITIEHEIVVQRVRLSGLDDD